MENYLFEGNISVKAAVMGGMREVSEIIVDEAKKDRDTQWILHRAAERGIPIVTASRAHIDSLASGHTHGGLLARCGARRFQQLKEIDSEACFLALIEGIEDPFNFGMILRTLYAAGCDGVILPPRNWTSAAATVARASAGASEYLPLIIADEMQQTLHALKQNGITLICAERKDAVCLYDFSFPSRLCLAIGGEMRGLSRTVKEAGEQNVFIPYGRDVRSALSAVSAASVFSFEILRQRNHHK